MSGSYRAKEYITEDQPWDPITAVTGALVGDISSFSMAIADIPRGLFKGAKKKSTADNASRPSGTSQTGETASVAQSDTLAGGSELNSVTDGKSETASLRPSINISAPQDSSTEPTTATDEASVIPWETSSLSTKGPDSPASSRKGKLVRRPSSPKEPKDDIGVVGLEAAVGAGKGVSRIVTTGMKSPMNFCLGLARGFRNAPKLYNDDTVRPPEKVTNVASGLRVAGKEFGLGLYDGLSGMVTQPIRGAEKEGAMGAVKGFGKGIGGLVLKSSAAFWSIPAYTMQGVHAEVRSMFAKSVHNYIFTSRVVQGREDLSHATPEEQRDIQMRWGSLKKEDLRGFYLLRQKEEQAAINAEGSNGSHISEVPKTGWKHTRHLSIDERKKLHEQKEEWRRRNMQAGNNSSTSFVTADIVRPEGNAQPYMGDESDEFERAIRESVKRTSRGNRDEDERIEAAIRASVTEMHRIANVSREQIETPTLDKGKGVPPALPAREGGPSSQIPLPGDGDNLDITDEEYQELIAEAVRQSLTASSNPGESSDDEEMRRALELSRTHTSTPPSRDDDEQIRLAIAESERAAVAESAGVDDDEQLRRVMAESERAHREQLARRQTEEDVVLEYVKKQSLAEEEFRRQAAKGKGRAGEDEDEDEDEELRRALEESLRVEGKPGEGSGAGTDGGKGTSAQGEGEGKGKEARPGGQEDSVPSVKEGGGTSGQSHELPG
jgi:hypothetical protein